MKIKTTKLLQFNELTKEQQEKVIDHYRLINVDYADWWEADYEMFEQELFDKYSLEGIRFDFSGFWSQGDGARISEGIISDLKKVKRLAGINNPHINSDTTHGNIYLQGYHNHYYHENTFAIEFTNDEYYENDGDKTAEQLSKLDGTITDMLQDECRDLYNTLRNTYEYLTSNESVQETLEVNEYYFNEETMKIDS